MHDVVALVLAAGRSERVASVLGGRSKVLLDIGGMTVLERNLQWLARTGIKSVWINLHYRPDEVKAVVGDGVQFGLSVSYSEEPELLGTAGAFGALATHWTRTVLVLYGDNVAAFDLGRLLERHRTSGGLATIALFDPRIHANSGIAGGKVTVDEERVISFAEGAEAGSGSSLVNAGVYALEPAVLAYVPSDRASDFGTDVFPALLAAGEKVTAHVLEPEGYCFGLDTPESLQRTLAAFDGGSDRTE
jgi:NDP-sugar pyrophosphorylase family protein